MIRAIVVAAGLILAAAPAFADEPTCDRNDQTQTGMNICAAADAAAADKKLNLLYQQLTAKAEANEKTALRDAQRAWVAYRDKECAYETIGSEGGSIRPMEESMCVTALTNARIADFQKFLSGD